MPTGIYKRSTDIGKKISEAKYARRDKYIIKIYCRLCGEEFKVLKSRRYRKYCNKKCGHKALSELRKIHNPGKFKKGNRINWKGGITPEYKRIRNSVEYKLWRKSVFERDNYKCIFCKKGGYLNADHIKSFAGYPELRFDINNGRTLCVPCHKQTPSYGKNLSKTPIL